MLSRHLPILLLPLLLSCSAFPARPVQDGAGDTGDTSLVDADAGGQDADDASGDTDLDAVVVDACRPQCGQAECGDDRCGGVCGACAPGTGCTSDGQCTPRPWTALTPGAAGFAAGLNGGADGPLCTVTNLDDDGPGSLRACLTTTPVWVHFGLSGRVVLTRPLTVPSNTTIDGRGQRITLANQPVTVADADNVILHNLTLDGTTFPAENGVFVYGTSRRVWLDRLTVTRYGGVGVYIADAATDITVSWCFFTDLPSGVIVGQPTPQGVRATLHHNLFRSVDRYVPLVRAAQVHAFNNVVSGWTDVGGAVFFAGELYSEANVFEREEGGLAIETHPSGEVGYLRSVDDRVSPGLSIEESWPQLVFEPEYGYEVDENGVDFVGLLNREAGFREAPFPSE